MNFEPIAGIADALLYEGYLLYPYRATAVKNQQRFTFGCLFPPAFPQPGTSTEGSVLQTECLLFGDRRTQLAIQARFLHLTTRTSPSAPTWQEAIAREVTTPPIELHTLATKAHHCRFAFPSDRHDDGQYVRTQRAIEGSIEVSAQNLGAGAFKLCVRLANLTPFEPADGRTRNEALAWSLMSCHLLLGAISGEFLSLLDPPATWHDAAASCRNIGVYPVLAGDPARRDTMLATPIILYDYPRIAAASPGNLFDGTEMDEMLTLRIRTLTDQEKHEMSMVDPHAEQLLARCESLPSEQLLGLHGVWNSVLPSPGIPGEGLGVRARHSAAGTAAVTPGPSCGVPGEGNNLQPGMRVRLRPKGNADAFDLALAGKTAVIVSIEQDFEEQLYVTVAVDDDPGQDLGIEGKPGHRFFFRPDEVEAFVDDSVTMMPGRAGMLIAGIGNIFFGDDAFGVAVVRRLMTRSWPADIVVRDFGIRGFDLACALQGGYDTIILVDAVGRGSQPGTLHILDLDPEAEASVGSLELHHLDLTRVLNLVRHMGGRLPRLRLIGCEPATLEPAVDLSEPVTRAVTEAIAVIESLIAEWSFNHETR